MQTLQPPAATAALYQRDGYCTSSPLLPPELIERAAERMDAVMNGEYSTGITPHSLNWRPGDDATKLRKFDQAHRCDAALLEAVSHPALGAWAAAATGAAMVQVWATQLLFKPMGGGNASGVGWHQDWQYWTNWWAPESEVFTAWLALSDVDENSGPLRFVVGSNLWGFLEQGDFFNGDLAREEIQIPAGEIWREERAILAPGAASLHHRFTYHGSGANSSDGPRRSLAIHLRTDKSAPASGSSDPYVSHLDDPQMCPVIYRSQ